MIEITVFRQEDELIGYQIRGHAQFADEGEDIVCAAVSALGLTGLFAYQKLLARTDFTDPEKGYLQIELPEGLADQDRKTAQIVFETVLTGLYQTAQNYPGYIEIHDERGEYSWK